LRRFRCTRQTSIRGLRSLGHGQIGRRSLYFTAWLAGMGWNLVVVIIPSLASLDLQIASLLLSRPLVA
jgi:hypothetical protein